MMSLTLPPAHAATPSLLGLPYEVRLIIYEHCLIDSHFRLTCFDPDEHTDSVVAYAGSSRSENNRDIPNTASTHRHARLSSGGLELLRTCRQTYAELTPIFMQWSVMQIDTDYQSCDRCEKWLDKAFFNMRCLSIVDRDW